MNATEIAPIGTNEAERISADMVRGLIDLLKTLPPEEWDRPTDCDLWSVRDHVAHQVGWHEALLSFPELMRQMGSAVRRSKELGNVIDAQNQVQVDARRGLSTDDLIARLENTYVAAATKRRKLGSMLGWIPAYSSYLGGWINVSYVTDAIFPRDIYMHRVDIAKATGKEMVMGESERRLIEDIIRDWYGRTKESVRLELTGPAGGTYEGDRTPTVTFTADAVEFTRLLFGRAERDVLEISGDRATAERALSVYFPV
ncbi:MAG TPA: maleylpyruvate isomerase family mycothiol-dependent enzyme [Actinomycetota bacterium]|nr:maleylpyruvate isomerase family mycothiol-dependent enzyme [Actinomycetota bacterium]